MPLAKKMIIGEFPDTSGQKYKILPEADNYKQMNMFFI